MHFLGEILSWEITSASHNDQNSQSSSPLSLSFVISPRACKRIIYFPELFQGEKQTETH
jgi:hypothetical protein